MCTLGLCKVAEFNEDSLEGQISTLLHHKKMFASCLQHPQLGGKMREVSTTRSLPPAHLQKMMQHATCININIRTPTYRSENDKCYCVTHCCSHLFQGRSCHIVCNPVQLKVSPQLSQAHASHAC